MMKRVCKTRVGTCAMLLAVFLLVGGVGAPAFARDDMSNGQTGDPNDGNDVASGGGTSLQGDKAQTVHSGTPAHGPYFVLVPMSIGGLLVFRVVIVPFAETVK
jgi:hypothetical protein